jgi:NNP family nitrate/nitrite transporter-like MFS transporter
MSTTIDVTGTPPSAAPAKPDGRASRRGRWIDHWEPEDPTFWAATGQRIARKNLGWSVFAEHLGFCIWSIWAIVVINLVNVGITLSVPEQFWLTATPNLIGSALRIPYTFALPRFGGRMWTFISALLLLIPTTLLAVVVPSGWLADQSHDTQMLVLLLCAATAGVGGGNFSSSMANISFFYPEGKKGFALGLNAAGGNLGVAVTQLVVPLVIIIGISGAAVRLPVHEVHLAYAGLLFMPLIALAALGAWWYMDSLTQARTDTEAYKNAVRQPQTWIMSMLYIGTFGSFIGYSFALPLGGAISDRIGGARVTLGAFLGMAAATLVAIEGVHQHSFATFFGAYMVIFLLAGAGNGSTYRMIPAIFAQLGRRAGADGDTMLSFKRQTAAVIGIAGAIGAFGGFLIQVAFRQASLDVSGLMKTAKEPAEKAAIAAAHQDWSVSALWVFCGAYVVLAIMTYTFYLRRGAAHRNV